MQYFFICILVGCLSVVHLSAQSNGVVVGGRWTDQVSLSDVNGRPFENKYADVNGNPYFDTAYKFATITLADGKVFKNVQVLLDLVAQEINFITANSLKARLPSGAVKEITYSDSASTAILKYTFRTGFPAIERFSQHNFYQVIVVGKCTFLRSITKEVVERKNEMSGEIAKDFEQYENYFLYVNGEMKRLKKDRDFVLSLLSDKQPQVGQFVQNKKLNFRNINQLTELFVFYNTL